MPKKILDYDGLTRYDGKIKEVIATKQDTLVSGTSIKTINNTSLLGSGNIEVVTEDPDSITDNEIRSLFDEEQSQESGN